MTLRIHHIYHDKPPSIRDFIACKRPPDLALRLIRRGGNGYVVHVSSYHAGLGKYLDGGWRALGCGWCNAENAADLIDAGSRRSGKFAKISRHLRN
ncbi:hypothetical protein Zmor_022123 [Zophobas morio]|uniref:Uncharacterized protein n=1 Tax=Zophobas morio TaxID=2755281 RepID=A0AA38HVS6_9CUCU|nr:hypothetical protein Zmor_022123 [Zophobas morio]